MVDVLLHLDDDCSKMRGSVVKHFLTQWASFLFHYDAWRSMFNWSIETIYLVFLTVLHFCYFLLNQIFSLVDSFKQSFLEFHFIWSFLITTNSHHNLLMIYIIFKRSIWKYRTYFVIKSIFFKIYFCRLFDNLPNYWIISSRKDGVSDKDGVSLSGLHQWPIIFHHQTWNNLQTSENSVAIDLSSRKIPLQYIVSDATKFWMWLDDLVESGGR